MGKKIIWQGGTQLAPVPVVLVGCGDGKDFKYNLITVAWAGTLSSNPPTIGIGVRPERYSRGLIEATGMFTVNMPTAAMAEKVDYCGVVSGRDVDKFESFPGVKRSHNGLVYVAENTNAMFSCKVISKQELGSHVLFVGEVTESKVLSEDPSCTYAYYHKAIKPKF